MRRHVWLHIFVFVCSQAPRYTGTGSHPRTSTHTHRRSKCSFLSTRFKSFLSQTHTANGRVRHKESARMKGADVRFFHSVPYIFSHSSDGHPCQPVASTSDHPRKIQARFRLSSLVAIRVIGSNLTTQRAYQAIAGRGVQSH